MSLIIDTDIGSDVDDAFALAYALKSGIDLKLITTVHGPTKARANIAKKITQLLGKEVPVASGESAPIKQQTIFLTGEEERQLEPGEEYEVLDNAVEVLADTITANRYNIEIAAIGPLTNIARVFEKYPKLPSYLNRIYVMGNAILTSDKFYLNYRAHNLKVDPEAADIVFGAKVPITLVTTEVCKKNYLTKEELQKFQGNALLDYLHNSAQHWLNFIKYEQVYLYDPLVIHHYLNSKVTEKTNYGNVEITTDVAVLFKDKLLEVLLK